MQLVLDNNGIVLKKRNHSFWVVHKKGARLISPHRLSSIAVVDDCLISSAAIKLAALHNVPIYFFNRAGKLSAKLWSPYFGSIATIRREQAQYALTAAATEWIIDLLMQKKQSQQKVLQNISKKNATLKKMADKASQKMDDIFTGIDTFKNQPLHGCRNQLLGIEGAMAKSYWPIISQSLPEVHRFAQRSRRPANDGFNAALNYLYGMLYGTVSQAIVDAGLDTHLGFLHVDAYNSPSFTFDLIEPFRPWVDELLVGIFQKGGVANSYFRPQETGIYLSKEGKRVFIPLFNDMIEQRILFDNKRLSRKNHIFRYASLFAQKLLNKG